MIPEAAVEAAARAWCGTGDVRDWQRRHITKLLEAAAPHMLAPVAELADQLVLSSLTGSAYQTGRGSGFRIAGTRIRQVLGLAK